MPLNDEGDRLKTAEEYLLKYDARSQEFEAALEHVRWVHANKSEYRPQCEQILGHVVGLRRTEKHVMAKLEAL